MHTAGTYDCVCGAVRCPRQHRSCPNAAYRWKAPYQAHCSMTASIRQLLHDVQKAKALAPRTRRGLGALRLPVPSLVNMSSALPLLWKQSSVALGVQENQQHLVQHVICYQTITLWMPRRMLHSTSWHMTVLELPGNRLAAACQLVALRQSYGAHQCCDMCINPQLPKLLPLSHLGCCCWVPLSFKPGNQVSNTCCGTGPHCLVVRACDVAPLAAAAVVVVVVAGVGPLGAWACSGTLCCCWTPGVPAEL
jgi:hypothetical protein